MCVPPDIYDFAVASGENVNAKMIAMNETATQIEDQVNAGEYTVAVDDEQVDVAEIEVNSEVECSAGQTNVDMMCGRSLCSYYMSTL